LAEKLFLVDGHSHCYQAFYAIERLTAPDGRPVNVVYGFLNVLRKVLKEYAPEYVAVAFDSPGPTFRHNLFAGYKAMRPSPPEDFTRQLPLVQRALEAYGVPVYAVAGFEADDIMGTLARQAEGMGLETYLLTNDKDAKQLLSSHVRMLDTRTGAEITAESLFREEGIRPEQVVDVMALAGDSSDNVPGIPGIGPKTARRLIAEWGSLDNLLAHADEVKEPRLRRKLVEHAEAARLSRNLVTIRTDAPIRLEPERCRVKAADESRLRALFQELGFKRFLADLNPAPVVAAGDYRLVNDDAALADFLGQLRQQKRFAFDTETTGVDPLRSELVGMSFSWRAGEAWYLPVRGPVGDRTLDRDATLRALAPILGAEEVGKVGHNLKFDINVMARHGVALRGVAFDTMVAAYLLDPTRGSYSLDTLAFEQLGHAGIPIESLIGKGKHQVTMAEVPITRVCQYAGEDADLAWRLSERLAPELESAGLATLYREVELPLIPVLAAMEFHGIKLDVAVLEALSNELAEAMAALEKKIYTEAGIEFNLASPKQLREVLFGKLGLRSRRRTRSGPSTDADVLAELASDHPVPALVMEYRQLAKLKNTYTDALPRMVNPATGRIHASFNQTMTATGRLSSSEPNLQNIPVRGELGSKIRQAFVPGEPGWLLLSADYSQIELRLVAHLSQDETLMAAFSRDEDIHAFVAAHIYGISPEAVTPAMRRTAKAVNFGIIYGQTSFGLARSLGIAVEEAEAFISAYFQRYPRVREFIDHTLGEARARKYVTTLWGRRRPLADINSDNPRDRSFAERAAVNTVVQGSAADLIKIAMVRVARQMRASGMRSRMLLQIHDELVFEAPPEEVETLRELATREMSGAASLRVPIKVNTAVGPNWLEAK